MVSGTLRIQVVDQFAADGVFGWHHKFQVELKSSGHSKAFWAVGVAFTEAVKRLN